MNPFNAQQRQAQLNVLAAQNGGNLTVVPAQLQSTVRDYNVVNIDLDTVIYRIFRYDRFLSLLQSRQNTLVHPQAWQDPFENFLLSSQGDYHGQPVSLQPIRDSWYGQCWTFKEECDGLWRSNTNNTVDRAVKVKTTVRRLFEGFYNFNNPNHILSFFIGRIRYVNSNQLNAVLQDAYNYLTDTTNISQLLTLLTKRQEFSFEDELRLLYCIEANGNPAPNIFQYGIDPNALFDEVVLDPWTSDAELRTEEYAMRQAGFNNLIRRSDLYQPFPNVIQIA